MKEIEVSVRDLIDWGFRAFMAVILGLGVPLFNDMVSSIDRLNHHIATLIERDISQRRELDRHERRLDNIEKEMRGQWSSQKSRR